MGTRLPVWIILQREKWRIFVSDWESWESGSNWNTLPQKKFDTIILAVAHKEFKALNLKKYQKTLSVIYDVKSVLDKEMVDGRL